MANTLRQKIAVQKISEILRKSKGQKNISMGRILREAGYAESVADHPDIVTQTKGFKELLKQVVPDNKVVRLQSDLMEASRVDSYKIDSKLGDEEITKIVEETNGCKVKRILRHKSKSYAIVYFWSPDHSSRLRALDMYYKLYNLYPKDKEETDTNAAVKTYLDKLSKILP